MNKYLILFFASLIFVAGCRPEEEDPQPEPTTDNVLRIKLKFDPDQIRLDAFGNESTVPQGHAAQDPSFHGMSTHFIELIPTEFTAYGEGERLYKGEEIPSTNANPYGFTTAMDFDQAIIRGEGETFLEIPLASIAAGTYRHVRVSVTYQNYDVRYNLRNIPFLGDLMNQQGRVASFVGFNNYITDLQVNKMTMAVNAAKLQGFWVFETDLSAPYDSYNQLVSGQAPENATTVVNPFPESPIPLGSCVVSGDLNQELVITGTETEDIELVLSFSVNKSFEWMDTDGNGQWDIDVSGSASPEAVVDMGLRGLTGLVNP